MRWTSLLLSLVLFLPLPAAAQEGASERATPKDRTRIEDCLSANPTAAQRRACINLVADPCRNAPEGASTLGMIECLDREHAVWDGLLNRSYRDAMAAFDEDGKAYLKATQQEWLKFRIQACQWPSKVYHRGTIAGPLTASCMLDQTALRTIDLMDIVAAIKVP